MQCAHVVLAAIGSRSHAQAPAVQLRGHNTPCSEEAVHLIIHCNTRRVRSHLVGRCLRLWCAQWQRLWRIVVLLARLIFLALLLRLVLIERRRTHQVFAWLRRNVARTPQHLPEVGKHASEHAGAKTPNEKG
jgi:hypothetical protein